MQTLQPLLLVTVIFGMVVLFLTEKIPYDLTALLVLALLLGTGVLSPEEAFSGFSSPTVITLVSTFIVAGALRRTGVADWCAWWVSPWVGRSERRAAVIIMCGAILFSAFMHNVAATALLLPAATSLAKLARVSLSRLLLPLSFGSMLGGMTTLIGTTPHLVVSDMLSREGFHRFTFLDFTPVGLLAAVAGTIFMVMWGRKLLPAGQPSLLLSDKLAELYKLEERFFSLEVPHQSTVVGRSIRQLELGTLLNVEVLAVERGGIRRLAPEAEFGVAGGDVLHVRGRLEHVLSLFQLRDWQIEPAHPESVKELLHGDLLQVEILRCGEFSLAGCRAHGLFPLATKTRHGFFPVRAEPLLLEPGDRLFALREGSTSGEEYLQAQGWQLVEQSLPDDGDDTISLLWLQPPVHWAAEESDYQEIPRRARLAILGGVGEGGHFVPNPDPSRVPFPERLLVLASHERLERILPLTELSLSSEATAIPLENRAVCLLEVLVPPRSELVGKTLSELDFRKRFGFQVVALWKEGRPHRTHVSSGSLGVGDALLLQGLRRNVAPLLNDPNFLVLSELPTRKARSAKRPHVVAGFAVMLLLMIFGFQRVHVTAFMAACWMVLCGAVKTREAYDEIEWPVIFLVASILPLGQALVKTGLADHLARLLESSLASFGPYSALLCLVVASSLIAQALDSVLSVALLSPVAFALATQYGVSVYPLMMGIAYGASVAFLTPVSHKAHLLVVTPGGYRQRDFWRVGLPLSLLLIVIIVGFVPMLFHF